MDYLNLKEKYKNASEKDKMEIYLEVLKKFHFIKYGNKYHTEGEIEGNICKTKLIGEATIIHCNIKIEDLDSLFYKILNKLND